MIYVTFKQSIFEYSHLISNIWEVKQNNVPELYKEFMHQKAKDINVIINPNWLSLMNWEDYNNHLSIVEYGKKRKQWEKIKKRWGMDKFISKILKGKKQNFYELPRV